MSTRRLIASTGVVALLILAGCTQAPAASRSGGAGAGQIPADTRAAPGDSAPIDPSTGPAAPAVAARAQGTMRPAPRGSGWGQADPLQAAPADVGAGEVAPEIAAGGVIPRPDLAAGPASAGNSGESVPAGSQAAVEQARGVPADRAAGSGNPAPPIAAARAERVRTVAIDPGHGGPEPGAASAGFAESDVNLQIGLFLRDMLEEAGYRAVMTRDHRGAVNPEYTAPGRPGQVKDLQARVNIANAAGADLFLSIHNNGSVDPNVRGTEVWYNNARRFSDRNRVLALSLLEGILSRLRAAGHPTVNRGIQDDANWRVFNGRRVFIFVLSPSETRAATEMPAALGESLFVSNPIDAAGLRRTDIQWAIAAGYRDAVFAYFDRFGT